jgi:hypothetical protein
MCLGRVLIRLKQFVESLLLQSFHIVSFVVIRQLILVVEQLRSCRQHYNLVVVVELGLLYDVAELWIFVLGLLIRYFRSQQVVED